MAATLLPGGSELLLLWLLNQGQHSTVVLIICATLGNTLGGLTTFMIGKFLAQRWQPEQLTQHHKTAFIWLQRHGHWSLLLSWLPIIGDPLCLVAGWLKFNFSKALFTILLGKSLRYIAIAALASPLF